MCGKLLCDMLYHGLATEGSANCVLHRALVILTAGTVINQHALMSGLDSRSNRHMGATQVGLGCVHH
jgi:hypothetical protein